MKKDQRAQQCKEQRENTNGSKQSCQAHQESMGTRRKGVAWLSLAPLITQPSPCSHHSCLKNSEAGCLELPWWSSAERRMSSCLPEGRSPMKALLNCVDRPTTLF